ncbi:hatching enzyme 1.2-like [Neocloeon triangulifer]|uniref:hatching enzyme 1.2-like n=1 Tax=Neocloeon triangulifer TaxID=2078957 RepID=UPI00286F6FF8|nr:hatching enzyme 1.2-like [Neocloeon triangulifer]
MRTSTVRVSGRVNMQLLSACALLSILLPSGHANPLPQKDDNDDLYEKAILKLRAQSLGLPDKRAGEILSTWDPDSGVNPEELGPYFQGDILTLPSDKNGIIDTNFRWADGVIPYSIVDGIFNETELQLLSDAFEAYHNYTCIKFVPYDGNQTDYIVIQGEDTGCWSSVGRRGGVQYVNLQPPGCIRKLGTPEHELLHTIGFHHEQSRTDRDDYVSILWANIKPLTVYNFFIVNNTSPFGAAYDYGSVMHYSATAFSSNALPTIETIPPGIPIGQRDGLSQSDIDRVNAMYNCFA